MSQKLRSKWMGYVLFAVASSVGFFVSFLFGLALNDFVITEFFGQIDQFSFVQIFDLLTLYILFFIFWDVILMFTLIPILNGIFARTMGYKVARITLITVLSIVISYVLFHVIMYIWFVYYDPLRIVEQGEYGYIINIIDYYTADDGGVVEVEDMFVNLGKFLFDVLFGFFYTRYFLTDPSLVNYILFYVMMKGLVSDVPFQLAGLPFNPYGYEVFFIFAIYFIVFGILFSRFSIDCECVTDEDVRVEIKEESEKFFGKKEDVREKVIKKKTNVRISKNIVKGG